MLVKLQVYFFWIILVCSMLSPHFDLCLLCPFSRPNNVLHDFLLCLIVWLTRVIHFHTCTFSNSDLFAQCLENFMTYFFFIQLYDQPNFQLSSLSFLWPLTPCNLHAYSFNLHNSINLIQHHISQCDLPLRCISCISINLRSYHLYQSWDLHLRQSPCCTYSAMTLIIFPIYTPNVGINDNLMPQTDHHISNVQTSISKKITL